MIPDPVKILPVEIPPLPSPPTNPAGNHAPRAITNQFTNFTKQEVVTPLSIRPEQSEVQVPYAAQTPEPVIEVIEPVPTPAPQPSAPPVRLVHGYVQTNGRAHRVGVRFRF